VVVEGRCALIKQLATFYDFRIWVDAPPGIRSRRLAELDGAAEEAYIAAEDPARTAHLRIDGSAPVDPAVQYVRL
jgi:cytidylate kinase